MRPFLSGRDYHALHHANPDRRFDAVASSNAGYTHEPDWYPHFQYEAERARGLAEE